MRPSLFGLFVGLALVIDGRHCMPASDYEGSSCQSGNSPGTCTLVSDCPPAQNALKHRRVHNLERCGFVGFVEVVCCPNIDLPKALVSTTTPDASGEVWTDGPPTKGTAKPPKPELKSSVRKSDQECQKYSNVRRITLAYHIVNGENAELGEFPHMAALGVKSTEGSLYEFTCGASLISNRYLLSAAHCILNIDQRTPVIARLGKIDVPKSTDSLLETDYNITNITVHPQYKWKEKVNDLALVELKEKVAMTEDILPACLYTKDDDPRVLWVTGWGVKEMGGERSEILQKAKLAPVPLKECNEPYRAKTNKVIGTTQICAADNRSDACQGDSGGPLQVPSTPESSVFSIVGVTSFGIGCGSKYPGIYTRIYSYLDWIEGIVWPDN